MDPVLLPLVATTLLMAGLFWSIWYTVADSKHERRRRRVVASYMRAPHGFRDGNGRSVHRFRGQGEAVTVAELLEDAVEQGEGLRLNWPTDDASASPIRADGLGQFPTVVLPRMVDDSA